jgi:RimJ/RimL family protein N-acetyltransferase
MTQLPQSRRLVLRRFCQTDLGPFTAWRNDPEVARYQGWESCSPDAAEEFLQDQLSRELFTPGRWSQIAITLKENGEPIGDCAVKIHEGDPRQATIGITLSRKFQGQGFASEALTALFSFLFAELNLHRIQADTDPRNLSCCRLFERLGMRREAHHRESLWFKGSWVDEYLYAILRSEWLRQPSR